MSSFFVFYITYSKISYKALIAIFIGANLTVIKYNAIYYSEFYEKPAVSWFYLFKNTYLVVNKAAAAVNPEPNAQRATFLSLPCFVNVSLNAIGMVQEEVLP